MQVSALADLASVRLLLESLGAVLELKLALLEGISGNDAGYLSGLWETANFIIAEKEGFAFSDRTAKGETGAVIVIRRFLSERIPISIRSVVQVPSIRI